MKKYKPIACALYDHYELWSVQRKSVYLKWKNEADKNQHSVIKIKTLFTKDKIEFLMTEDGKTIRLDRILESGLFETHF